MPDTQDNHPIRLDAIAQHIGPDDRYLPPSIANRLPALGKLRQTIGNCDQLTAAAGLNAEI